jgi:hypothetical protein
LPWLNVIITLIKKARASARNASVSFAIAVGSMERICVVRPVKVPSKKEIPAVGDRVVFIVCSIKTPWLKNAARGASGLIVLRVSILRGIANGASKNDFLCVKGVNGA